MKLVENTVGKNFSHSVFKRFVLGTPKIQDLFGKGLMKKKVVPKLRQEVKVDIVTSDDIKLYFTGKFQNFTARYVIKPLYFESRSFKGPCFSNYIRSPGKISTVLHLK